MAVTKQGEIIVQGFRGLNKKLNKYSTDDSELQIANNVVVTNGSVAVRGGLTLHSSKNVTGGVPMMKAFYKRDGTKQLVLANDDDYYYITPSNTTWQDIGDYGTAVDNPSAYQYKNVMVFGTGSTANTPKKWDGSSFTNISTPASANGDLRFYTQYLGNNVRFLVGAGLTYDNASQNVTTLFYTPDPDDWGTSPAGNLQVGFSDGSDITGLIQNNDLVVYRQKSKHNFASFLDDLTGLFALRETVVDNSSGSPNHESLVVIDGDVVTLTQKKKSIEGYGLEGTAQGNARPKQYATYINPILDKLTWQKSIIAKSRGIFYDRKAFYAVPYNGSQYNNVVLVGDWDTPTRNAQPSWTTWSRPIGSFEIFEDENGIEQLYLGDALEPKIYRYDPDTYSDNGSNYSRQMRTKAFSIGRLQNYYDDMMLVKITGFMRKITEFTLKVIVDGKEQKYIIDKDQLVKTSSSSGGLIGSSLVGDGLIGGNSVGSDKFRYEAFAQIPNALRYGKYVEIDISNNGAGQYWDVDSISINEKLNLANIPDNHKNLRTI